jgi:hypothetical protein
MSSSISIYFNRNANCHTASRSFGFIIIDFFMFLRMNRNGIGRNLDEFYARTLLFQ